jgi:hypothetical protein
MAFRWERVRLVGRLVHGRRAQSIAPHMAISSLNRLRAEPFEPYPQFWPTLKAAGAEISRSEEVVQSCAQRPDALGIRGIGNVLGP